MNSENALALSEVRALTKDLSSSKLLPTPLQGKPADVLAIVLVGRELGLGPMQSVRGMDVIQGKLSMSSALIGALIMSSPDCEYLTPVEFTDKIATYETKRKGSPNPVRMSFTFEEAKLAGLTSKDNYRKNPTAMLLARAQARIGRAVYPDKCLGVYDRDSGELDPTPEPVPQTAHVQSVKDQLRAQVSPAADVVEGEIVSVETPDGPVQVIAAAIRDAATLDDLKALIPTIGKLTASEKAELRPVYDARKAELNA